MIYRTLEDGTTVVEAEDTQSLGNIQAEKVAALALNPALSINPCSVQPLAEAIAQSTTE